MPRLAQAVPRYRKHKATGQAFVELNSHRHYLGPHGSRVSRDLYDRMVGEWLQAGRLSIKAKTDSQLLVIELIAAYLSFSRGYYRKGGKVTSEYAAIIHAMRPLKELYGSTQIGDFGPIALQVVLAKMVECKWSRTTINRHLGRIKRMIKWGVAQELVPATTYHGLCAVVGLRKGRTSAHENEPVTPIRDEIVNATIHFLPQVIADMVRIQRLTGCRPMEVCSFRLCDIKLRDEVWEFYPASHKTEHHAKRRIVFIGPKAIRILQPYLARAPKMHFFRPIDSEGERRSIASKSRKTPLLQGNCPGSNRKPNPKRAAGVKYTVDSYRRAIAARATKHFLIRS